MNAQLAPNGLDVRRTGRITGSRIAGILGKSPYNTRADVLREMVREHFGSDQEFVGNIATEHGKKHEQDALAWYESEKCVMTFSNQEFIIHPEYDFLAVTIDGRVENGLIECKAPFKSKYTEMPSYYDDQVQLQMACAQVDWCDFVCWREDGTSFTQRIYATPNYVESVLPALELFINEFDNIINDKKLSEPFLVSKGRSDDAWLQAAAEYKSASTTLELAKLEQDAAKERLLELSGGESAKGCGVSVIKTNRKGSIKYADVIKELLPETDLTPWTGEPTTVYSVRIDK